MLLANKVYLEMLWKRLSYTYDTYINDDKTVKIDYFLVYYPVDAAVLQTTLVYSASDI